MAAHPTHRSLNSLRCAFIEMSGGCLIIPRFRLRALLYYGGYSFEAKAPNLALSQRQMNARVAFCLAMLKENATTNGVFFGLLVLSDESWMEAGDFSRGAWQSETDIVYKLRTHHSTKIMIWGAIAGNRHVFYHWWILRISRRIFHLPETNFTKLKNEEAIH